MPKIRATSLSLSVPLLFLIRSLVKLLLHLHQLKSQLKKLQNHNPNKLKKRQLKKQLQNQNLRSKKKKLLRQKSRHQLLKSQSHRKRRRRNQRKKHNCDRNLIIIIQASIIVHLLEDNSMSEFKSSFVLLLLSIFISLLIFTRNVFYLDPFLYPDRSWSLNYISLFYLHIKINTHRCFQR